MRTKICFLLWWGSLCSFGCGGVETPVVSEQLGLVTPMHSAAPTSFALSPSGIDYHGGPVIVHPTVYYIWYGDWAGSAARAILTDFALHLSGTDYFAINSTYGVAKTFNWGGAVDDVYSHGATLGGSDVPDIVAHAITTGLLPADANGVYFVLTSEDVTVPSFCGSICGYHTHTTIAGVDIKYAFVGDPMLQCPSTCGRAATNGPNEPHADAMATVIAHELDETVSDPDLNAWYDGSLSGENGDKCAWDFGTTYSPAPGKQANIHLAGRDYLIQRDWVNDIAGGYCSIGINGTPILVSINGKGSVTSSPIGLTCGSGGTCAHVFPTGTVAQLTAFGTSAWPFSAWSGCDLVSGTHCQVAASAPRSVAATFTCVSPPDGDCYASCMDDCDDLKKNCVAKCRARCSTC
jgi:hypothetical protein